jgi:signal transduction histidine kinase/ActR/RegA family two-component response regulator
MEFSFYFPPEYLRAGLLVSLLSVWLLVGLFAYLNHYTQRRYFTVWTAAWLFYALWLTLDFGRETVRDPRLIEMAREWCAGVSAVFLCWGSLLFMGRRQRQATFGLFIVFLLTFSYLAVYHLRDALWTQVAIHSILGLASLQTAVCFLRYRRRKQYMGASLLAVGLGLWGGYLGGYPIWETQYYLRAAAFFLGGVIQLFIAVSMIVLVLEETRANVDRLVQSNRNSREVCAGLQSRMRSSEDRYRKLFEQASDAIIITGAADLEILELNQRARRLLMIASFEPGRQSLRSFLDCLPEITAAAGGLEVFECVRAARTLYVVATDGNKTPVQIEGTVIEFEGRPAYQFAIREVTERVRLEQQLRQVEKLSALGQMISGVAHELNSPLAVIKGYLELILSRDHLPEQVRHDLQKVAHESTHAAKLVGNFLSFARQQRCERVPTDLNVLVERVAERCRMDPRSARIETQLKLDRSLPSTCADPDKLEQVVKNLLTNARQALANSPRSGLIRIGTERTNGTLRLLVEDNGPGVPAHLESKIFEPFFTTKQVGEGTGLGLSISHSILCEHHGRLYHRPSSLGGACFVMELPVTAPGSNGAALAHPPIPLVATSVDRPQVRPARVLIVDDERALAEMLEQIVQYLGHHTTVCLSPLEALKEMERADFDLILSDYRMPHLNGRQFYERVRELKPHLIGRMVFLTGDVANEETHAFLTSIDNAIITKPFHLHAVETAITAALQKLEDGASTVAA